MYLRTPKRYRPGRRRQLRLFSGRTVLMLMLIPLLGYAGWIVWQHKATIRSTVQSEVDDIMSMAQTQIAPKATPTATPDLAVAESSCTNAYRTGDLEEAILQCEVLASSNPNDVNLYYDVTHMMIITSNFGRNTTRIQEALDFAERAVSADPESPSGWAIRAMALDWSGDYGRALASALHAKALDANYAPTYAFLGEIYQDLGQYEIAMGYLEQALELDTSGIAVSDTFRNQGLWYSNQGFWEDALIPYQAAIQNAPTHTYISIELANNYIALGEIERAVEVLSSARELNPSDTSVMFALANAYTRDGDFERAYEYYRRCLDIDPDNIPCLSYLGGLQWSDGDFVTASSNLQRAIDLGSEDPDDYYQLGHSQTSLGHCDTAIPVLWQGYQIASEDQDEARIQKFAAALRTCGQTVGGVDTTETTETEAEVSATETSETEAQ